MINKGQQPQQQFHNLNDIDRRLVFLENNLTPSFNQITLKSGYTPDEYEEGSAWWNDAEKTWNIATGFGTVLQVGQEIQIPVYNNSDIPIADGMAVYPNGAFKGYPTIGLAKSDTHETISVDYGMTTSHIPAFGYGKVVWFGKGRGLDTTGFNLGDPLYISPTTAGLLTNVRPAFPNYTIAIGIVFKIGKTDGEIFITSRSTITDSVHNYFNGTFREEFKFEVTSNGSTTIGTLSPKGTHPDLTMLFSEGRSILDTSTAPLTIDLIDGTATVPQKQYVYITKINKSLEVSTSEFPYDEEHIKVAEVSLMTSVITQTYEARAVQYINDFIANTDTQMGGHARQNERTRQLGISHRSGMETTIEIIPSSDPDDVYPTLTSGISYQVGRHTFQELVLPTNPIIVFNDSVLPNKYISNINEVLLDSTGSTLINRSFTIVLVAIQNSGDTPDQWGINLPSGSYNSASSALADAGSHVDISKPTDIRGVCIPVARMNFSLSASGNGTWTLDSVVNITGEEAVGGGSGGGATNYDGLTDTPSSKVGNALKLVQVASGETAHEYTNSPSVDTVKFPTTQSPSSDVNTLDDYEEGTWTPVYQGTTGIIGSTAYSQQNGRYVKIGQMVHLNGSITLTDNGSWTGNVKITGIPFLSGGFSGWENFGNVYLSRVTFTGLYIVSEISLTGNFITIREMRNGTTSIPLATGNVPNNGSIFFSISYKTAT